MTGLECQHLFCGSCWDQYLRVMVITEGKGEVSDVEWIDCIFMKIYFFSLLVVHHQTVTLQLMKPLYCKKHFNTSHNNDISHLLHYYRKYLRQPEARSKYQYLITNSFVQEHRQLKWCPSPGCQNAVLVNQVEAQPVVCKCGHSFW